jgi:DNA-binding transcriptional MerR regulator
MASYSIGDMEELTGIKAHILRYWEEVIPGFAPKKDIGGRRTYSRSDLQIILRLKYLIQEKKFTIEGAREQLLAEKTVIDESRFSSDHRAELIERIAETRDCLLDVYTIVHSHHTKNAGAVQ